MNHPKKRNRDFFLGFAEVMAVGKKSRVGQKSLRDLAAFNLRGQKYGEGERPKK